MRTFCIAGLLLAFSLGLFAQKATVVSPNRKISIELFNAQNAEKW